MTVCYAYLLIFANGIFTFAGYIIQRIHQRKISIICQKTKKSSPGKGVKLLSLWWMLWKGPSCSLSRISKIAAAFPEFKCQLHFCECELSCSSRWPLKGLGRLMGLHQAARSDGGGHLSNGVEMFSWPRAPSDLDNKGSFVMSGFFFPFFVPLGQHYKSDWNGCPQLVWH